MSTDVAPNRAQAAREWPELSGRASTTVLVVIVVFYAIVFSLLADTLATRNAWLPMRLASFGAHH